MRELFCSVGEEEARSRHEEEEPTISASANCQDKPSKDGALEVEVEPRSSFYDGVWW